MITELEITGYKALRSINLSGLKRLTLLGGKNNTGKTSVMEGFFLSRDWGNAELLTRHLTWRGIDSFSTNPDSAWAPSFTDFMMTNRIQVRTRSPQGDRHLFTVSVVESSAASPTQTMTSTADSVGTSAANVPAPSTTSLRLTYTQASKTVYDAHIAATGGVPPYALKVTKIEGQAERVYLSVARTRPSAHEDAVLFGQLDEQRRTDELLASLRMLEPDLKGLSAIPVGLQSQLFADLEGVSRKVPINLLGDGITRLLSMLLRLSMVSGGYLLVDEFENGFHYSVLPRIWKTVYAACKAQRCQLIATTHSYECLTAFADALKEETEDDYSYIRLDKARGTVTPTHYDAKQLREATGSGWEVR